MTKFYPFSLLVVLVILAGCSSEIPKLPVYSNPIQPPLRSVAVEFNRFELNPAQSNLLRLANGSSLMVPENAFVDESGNAVKGRVSLQYREFHSPAQILASGIPMDVKDGNGVVKHLESGGMFEINASDASGQKLSLAQNKTIQVNLASKVEGDFDFYYLEEQKNAAPQAVGSFIPASLANKELLKQYSWKKLYSPADSLKKASDTSAKSPIGPKFQLHFDTKKYAETAILDTVNWEYFSPGDGFEDPTIIQNSNLIKKEKWSSFSIQQPAFRTALQKEFRVIDKPLYIILFQDSSGYLLGNDFESTASWYDWNDQLKATYSNLPGKNGHGRPYVSISKSCQYISFASHNSDQKTLLKIFTKEGKLVYTGTDIDPDGSLDEFEDENRIGYFTNQRELQYKIIDLKAGKVKAILPTSGFTGFDQQYIPYRSKYIITRNGNTVSVHNTDGKLLSNTVLNITPELLNMAIAYAYNPDYIVLKHYRKDDHKKTFCLWDWKRNKFYEDKTLSSEMRTDPNDKNMFYQSDLQVHPTEPLVLAYKDSIPVIWNLSTGKVVELTNYKNYGFSFYGEEGKLRSEYFMKYAKKDQVFLDRFGKQIYQTHYDNDVDFSEDGKWILDLSEKKGLFLKDKTGKTIRALTPYDSTLWRAYFTKRGNIFAFSKEGFIYLWNVKGELLKSTKLNLKGYHYFLLDENANEELINCHSENEETTLYNFKGELLYSYDYGMNFMGEGYGIFNFYQEGFMTHPHPNIVRHWKKTNTKLDADVFLLKVKNSENDFSTYVRLTPNQKELIDHYMSAFAELQKKEAQRQEKEQALLRRFEISQMGIYNWDRFYKDTTSLLVNASFDFDSIGTDNINLTVFLITGKDRTAVIKYPKNAWSKFSFNPDDPNLLIAILPNEKIALMTEEDFKSLDLEALKKAGTYKFRMKLLDAKASQEMLEKILQKPS